MANGGGGGGGKNECLVVVSNKLMNYLLYTEFKCIRCMETQGSGHEELCRVAATTGKGPGRVQGSFTSECAGRLQSPNYGCSGAILGKTGVRCYV